MTGVTLTSDDSHEEPQRRCAQLSSDIADLFGTVLR
jgi:hypothetical protein